MPELETSAANEEAATKPANGDARRLTAAEWLLISIGSAVLFASTLNATSLLSANDRSRWSTVWALVERGTFVIDEIDARPGWTTIDKVLHDGHLYSSKPPLLPTLVAGVYWGLKNSLGFDLLTQTDQTTRLILLIINWLPTSLAFVVFARLVRAVTDNSAARIVTLSAFCSGTLVTGYATTFNNHSIAAICVVLTLAPLLRILNSGSRRGSDFAAVGFWAAFACCNELPAALFGLATFFLLVRRDARRTAIWYAPAALLPLVAYFATNWLATGGIKPFYAWYGTDKYLYALDGVPSYWMNPQGLDRAVDHPLTYLFHCTLGHHGILSLSPIFLLTVLSWTRRSWWANSPLKTVILLGGGLTAAVLAFYLSRTENYNYGGNTYGLRWMIWLIPFWLLASVPVLERLLARRRVLAFVLLLLGISIYSACDAARNPWSASWAYSRMESAGWIDYSTRPPAFSIPYELHTWFAELPADHKPGVWIEFQSGGFGGDLSHRRRDVLRVTNLGRSTAGQTRQVRFEWNPGHRDGWTALVTFDVEAFRSGQPVEKTMLGFESGELSRSDLLTFLRGVPVARPYRPGVIRYLHTEARRDAYRCQRAATQVNLVRSSSSGDIRIAHRTDLWLCDELPFGTARFELTATDTATGELLTRRSFQVTAVGTTD